MKTLFLLALTATVALGCNNPDPGAEERQWHVEQLKRDAEYNLRRKETAAADQAAYQAAQEARATHKETLAHFVAWAAAHAKKPRVGTGFAGQKDCVKGECLALLHEPTPGVLWYETAFFPAKPNAVRFSTVIRGAYRCEHLGGVWRARKDSGTSFATRCVIREGALAGWGAQLFLNADETTVVTVFTSEYLAAAPRFASELPQ